MSTRSHRIAVVGAGPRGLSVVERLCANAARYTRYDDVEVHLIDPHLRSGGRVWSNAQASDLLMNTVASQVTVFIDDSVDCEGPIRSGPSLYDWARSVASADLASGLPGVVRYEARAMGPEHYPTRAFYGYYLRWALDHVVAGAPEQVMVRRHADTAVDMFDGPDGTQTVVLGAGPALTGLSAVVLAQGHLSTAPSGDEQTLLDGARRHGLIYMPPMNPAEAPCDQLPAGETVLLKGLGLNFFDYMSSLTLGRGGHFTQAGEHALRYHPSGREPRLVAGCRRGAPHHARGENQKGVSARHAPLFLTEDVIEAMRDRADTGAPPDFRAEVWPLIDREVRAVYYTTLLAHRDGDERAAAFRAAFVRAGRASATRADTANEQPPLSVTSEAEQAVLDTHAIGRHERWDWRAIANPVPVSTLRSADDYRAWLLDHLAEDVRQARLGNLEGPLKAALDVLRDLRNEVRLVVDHGGITGDSYRDDLEGWYTPLNAYLSIGPPPERTAEMIALIEAGVLEILGPSMTVELSERDGCFRAWSRAFPEAVHTASALVEARLPETDIQQTTDPLLRTLLARGRARPYRIPRRDGGEYETTGLAVSPKPYHLVDAAGRSHPHRFAFGVPTDGVHWATAAGIRPGVNSVILGDADAVANGCLSSPPAIEPGPENQAPDTRNLAVRSAS